MTIENFVSFLGFILIFCITIKLLNVINNFICKITKKEGE